jgi:hypothetical protein
LKIIIEKGEYSGNPILSIRKDIQDRYPFSFGIGKAKLLLQALKQEPDFLEKFVQENEGGIIQPEC